jgi:hypothetical protein
MYGRADGMPSFQLTVAVCACFQIFLVYELSDIINQKHVFLRLKLSLVIARTFWAQNPMIELIVLLTSSSIGTQIETVQCSRPSTLIPPSQVEISDFRKADAFVIPALASVVYHPCSGLYLRIEPSVVASPDVNVYHISAIRSSMLLKGFNERFSCSFVLFIGSMVGD